MSEFDALLKKSRNEAVSNIIPCLCEIYDLSANLRSVVKINPVNIENHFFSLIAGIQPGILQDAFCSGDVHGGFAGRFAYVYDRATREIPIPMSYDRQKWDTLAEQMRMIYDKYREIEQEMRFTVAAEGLWKDFYSWYKAQDKSIELLNTLNGRIQCHVLKLAMIFSVIDECERIDVGPLEDAIDIGKWLMNNNRKLFGEFGMTKAEKLEKRILEILSSGEKTRREIHQKIGGKMGYGKGFGEVMDTLLSLGIIKTGTKRNTYRLS